MITLVTAANENYKNCLRQLLRSVKKRCDLAEVRVVIFDLGLLPDTRTKITEKYSWAQFRTFIYEKYPPHVVLENRNYAWKPLVVFETVQEFGGIILWMDSANILKGPLDPMMARIKQDGILCLKGQSPLAERCEPAVLDALNVSDKIRIQPERFAGLIGFNTDNPTVAALLEEWQALALQPELIAPKKRTQSRHMWEQALLSILVLKAKETKALEILDEQDVDISSPFPMKWLTTRNKISKDFPIWLIPCVEYYYDTYKFFDQRWIRFNQW